MSAFNTIALIGRYHSPDVATALATMGEYLRRQGRAVLLEKETAATNGVSGFPIADYDEIGARADLVVVQGGDGSMLNAARTLAAHHVPLVGVNQGRLGFMTDIASPHTLSNRPIMVSDRTVIEISLKRSIDARLHFDGQLQCDLEEGDRVVIRRAEHTVKFVHPPGYSYFAMLRQKLHWSEVL